MPQDDELAAAKAFDGDLSRLADTDLFIREVSGFQYFQEYCELMVLQRNASSSITEIITPLRTIVAAAQQVMNSPSLKYIMQLVLRIGNILNGGGNRGGAYGFKISSLTKLADARAAVPGVTLLTFVVETVTSKNPKALAIAGELVDVPRAAEIEIEAVRNQFMPLRGKFELVKKKAEEGKMPNEFCEAARQLSLDNGNLFAEASQLVKQATDDSKALLSAFFEDPETTRPAEFFGSIAKFIKQFEELKAELEKKRLEAERAASAPSARAGKGRGPVDFRSQQRGVMDDLLARLRTGQLKRVD
jgi:hypothetical protein